MVFNHYVRRALVAFNVVSIWTPPQHHNNEIYNLYASTSQTKHTHFK